VAQQYYVSTSGQGVIRFDPPTYVLYVGIAPGGAPATGLGYFFPGGYVGPFGSVTGIVQVYMGSYTIQSRDIQATDNPANFPGIPLATLYLDAVGRIQQISDYTH
jgi:hypothetical protein